MTDDEARRALSDLVRRYCPASEADRLLKIINDASLPSVPVKGILAELDSHQTEPFDPRDEALVAELNHYFI